MGNFAERLGYAAREFAKSTLGATFWLKTTVLSVAIPAQGTTQQANPGINLTNLSEGGELLIEDIIIRGNSDQNGTGGGLSNGGTTRIICTNNFGSSVVFAVGVPNVGTSMVMSITAMRELLIANSVGMNDPLITRDGLNQPTILEEGKRLMIYNLAGAGLGEGSVTIHIKFRKLSDEANVTIAT